MGHRLEGHRRGHGNSSKVMSYSTVSGSLLNHELLEAKNHGNSSA